MSRQPVREIPAEQQRRHQQCERHEDPDLARKHVVLAQRCRDRRALEIAHEELEPGRQEDPYDTDQYELRPGERDRSAREVEEGDEGDRDDEDERTHDVAGIRAETGNEDNLPEPTVQDRDDGHGNPRDERIREDGWSN
ncbi:hypothetical protein [Halovivax asiaticus]|uniref:hypothetical protein n=1 Tax=Halovivax asiaticus TaxID=332953 RepID=UPI0013761833|nr:hypothetical protein [Halovivax asiaticus]